MAGGPPSRDTRLDGVDQEVSREAEAGKVCYQSEAVGDAATAREYRGVGCKERIVAGLGIAASALLWQGQLHDGRQRVRG